MHDGHLMLIGGALLAAGLAASLVAVRLRVPSLLVFLGIGMAVGSDGTGWIKFDDYGLALDIGVVALALILFEGGLASGWDEIRPVVWPAFALATLGTLATAMITGFAAVLLLDLPVLEGLLLGSIVASTDSAAIFAVLRGSTLRRKLARTLEGEAGLNDPVAILLVLGFIEWIQQPDYGLTDMLMQLVLELGIGAAAGLAVGFGAVWAIKRIRLASAGLYPVASIAAAALAFGGAGVLHGSGFLAVYLAGLVIGTAQSPARRTMATFHDGLAWVAQLSLFLTLGLLVFPGRLDEVAWKGVLLALILTIVARPAAVLLFAGRAFTVPERLAMGWAGLRGAVPVVLATFPVLAGLEGSTEFFDIVFFAVLVSTLLQGTTFEPVARRLGVTTTASALPVPLIDPATIRRLGAEVIEHRVGADDAIVGRLVRELGLPREALLNVIIRGDQAIPPRGSSRIEAGDRLHVLVRQEVSVEFAELVQRWRTGPLGPSPRVSARLRNTIFTSRPWRAEDGNASRPSRIDGLEVIEQLRTRRDRPGALVVLEDGRYAITGDFVAIGPRRTLQGTAERQLSHTKEDAEMAWWREVVGALASPS